MSLISPADGVGSRSPRDLPLTENARKVLEARYLKKDESGACIEGPAALFRRVARTVADVELQYGASEGDRQQWEDRFYRLVAGGSFMPNSPTLMNAGREMGMLSACFVLPVRDSVAEIFNSIKHTALIQKAGGGTGFAFDELRPTGDFIRSSGGTTSGPISFWRAFSEATNAIQQGAFRRGANMGMMYIHHPDILKFLCAKQDLTQFTNYNISVKITDTWMKEFLADPDAPHVVRNPRSGTAYVIPREVDIAEYDIRALVEIDCVEPVRLNGREQYYRSPRLTGELPAALRGRVYTKRQVWDIVVNNAWRTGEPGVVFMDRINEHNQTPQLGRIEATNPCGEQPLLPYEACNLGSVNLGRFVLNACTPEAGVDWDALRETVHLATRFLDNVIDANNYPLPEIDRICKANRKIGLGIMGFADALYKLGVAYNSAEGLAWGERFMRFVNDEAHNYSEHLARWRGCFENWRGSVWQTRHNRMMRNAAVTTVAPTGTISIIANCSGGIEPMFSLVFVRDVLRDRQQGQRPLLEVNETFRRVAEARGILSQDLLERVAREGTLAPIEAVPEDIKRVFVCAHDISPEWHVQMQAAFQRHCDSSISKTINFPASASPQDVEQIYRLAFELGCKGVTVYRDGCRAHQPMALKKRLTTAEQEARSQAPPRAESASAPRGAEPLSQPPAPPRAPGSAGQLPDHPREAPAASPAAPGSGDGNNGDHAAEAGDNGNDGHARNSVPPPATARASARCEAHPAPPPLEPRDLPEIVSGLRIRQMTPFGNMHVKITVDPHTERELEVFAQLGKGGDVANGDLEAICRTASLWLRAGGTLRPLIKQWEGIGTSLQIPTRTGRIMSLGDGLASALKLYLRAKERFGLRALLLGEIDLAELRNPHRPPHAPETTPLDRTLQGSRAAPVSPGPATGGGDRGAQRVERTVVDQAPPHESRLGAAAAPRDSRRAGRGEQSHASAAQAAPAKTSAAQNADETEGPTFGDTAVALAELDERCASECRQDVELRVEAAIFQPVAPFSDETVSETNGNAVSAAAADWSPPRHFHDAAAFYNVKCPECGGILTRQEGCRKCQHCGWAAC